MQLRDMAQASIFGRPGHGAPTNDIRKKKFTEYQLDIANKPDFDGEKEESYNPTIASIRYVRKKGTSKLDIGFRI